MCGGAVAALEADGKEVAAGVEEALTLRVLALLNRAREHELRQIAQRMGEHVPTLH